MKKLIGAIIIMSILLTSCAVTVSPSLASDGNKAVAVLKALETDATVLGVSADVVLSIGAAATAVQTAVADLQAGKKTPADFAKLATDEINALALKLLPVFHANPNALAGVILAQQLALIITQDATPAPVTAATAAPGVRTKIDGWLNKQPPGVIP